MKIEKINENQIRCFLSKQELDSRHLHLKELAYGTEKARALFQELMEEAFRQYGFIVENMPVMVEAVPLQDDSLVLIITRVENPEELDTRFSNFAPSVKSGGEDEGAKDSSSVLSQLLETIRRELGESKKDPPPPASILRPGLHALRDRTAKIPPPRKAEKLREYSIRILSCTPFTRSEERRMPPAWSRISQEKAPSTATLLTQNTICFCFLRKIPTPLSSAGCFPPSPNSAGPNTSLRRANSI